MRYTTIIDSMTWSYSRIKSFEFCPYKFLLTYILKEKKINHFFSDYGKFIHDIIAKKLEGELSKNELELYYITEFGKNITPDAPSMKIYRSYFEQGLHYMKNFPFPYRRVSDIERYAEFEIGDKNFVGYIDAIAEDENKISIIDHKSRALKRIQVSAPNSKHINRKKPTKAEVELEEYLKQLYLYSVAYFQLTGRYPDELVFNCFRNGDIIKEVFDIEKCKKASDWAINTIEEIRTTDDWLPKPEFFKCRYLCDVCSECCYSELV